MRLLLLVLLAVLPAFALLSYAAQEQRRLLRTGAEEEVLRLARVAAAENQGLIEGTRLLLATLADLPLLSQRTACDRLLGQILAHNPRYANLGVASAEGTVVCSARPDPDGRSVRDRSYFQRALRDRVFSVGEYQKGRVSGKPGVNFGYPVVNRAGTVTGVVFAALDLTWFSQFVVHADLSKGATLTVVDRNGTVLVRYPEPERWIGHRLPQSPVVKMLQSMHGERVGEMSGMDGVRRIYAFVPLERSPAPGVFLSVGIPRAAVFKDVERIYALSLGALSVMGVLTLLLAWLGGNAFVLNHVDRLIAAARRLAQGNLRARSGLAHGRDEFGELALAFDDMAAALERREDDALRSAEEIRLLQSLTLAVSTAENVHDALGIVLKKVCESTGWILGQAWTPQADGNALELSSGWFGGDGQLEAFREASQQIRLKPGAGLPGRVWARRAPAWISDLREDDNFPRDVVAEHAGLRAGMAVPVIAGDEVIAVMEFFMCQPREEDLRLLGVVSGAAAQLGVVMQRKRAEERLRYLAYHDVLTELPNRVYLTACITAEIKRASGDGGSFGLLVIGLERFGDINYTLGHAFGDLLLKATGPRLHQALPEAELAYLGSRRFAALLPHADIKSASAAATRVNRAFEQPFDIGGVMLETGAAVGIAVWPAQGADPDILVRHADVAVSQAQSGGHGWAIYDPSRDPYNPRRLRLLTELRSAVAKGQLQLYCQPKADMKTGRIVAAEALVRWHHPEFEMVPPEQFIPLVESTGLIAPLTQWSLDAAMDYEAGWRAHGLSLPLAVNLSARNLSDPRLPEEVDSTLRRHGASPEWLDLEITESAFMADPGAAIDNMKRLSSMDLKLFIDDFGTGYSSLSYLQKLPVDAIKVDKSFVMAMNKDPDAEVIVRSTIELGHNLGLRVVAEGVESREVWDRLVDLGCDEAQGNYISPPRPAGDMAGWLRQSQWSMAAVG